MAGVAQVLGEDRLQPKAFVQLADQHQAGVRGDARSLKRDLQKAVEGELKGLGFSLTDRVSPILGGFVVRNSRKSSSVEPVPLDEVRRSRLARGREAGMIGTLTRY